MRPLRCSLALLGLALTCTPAPAQRFFPNPYLGGAVAGRGLHLGYRNKRLHVSFNLFAARSYGYGYGYPFAPPLAPYYAGTRRVTVVYYSPPPPPPVVVLPPPVVNVTPPPVVNVLPPPQAPEPENPPLPPGREAGKFRPLDPDNRDRARREAKPEPLPEEEPRAWPPEVAPLPMPPAPENDPEAENARLVQRGREAFAAGEYARAARQFRRANAVWADNAPAYFLLAQALFAQGKYIEAVEALREGFRRDPDWATSAFRPLDLYGPHVFEHSEHLRLLGETLARHPDEPALLFLHAYQLWFDGRRDEAREPFRRARARGADGDLIDRFLQAFPPAGVL
jgi:hypothetical protein